MSTLSKEGEARSRQSFARQEPFNFDCMTRNTASAPPASPMWQRQYERSRWGLKSPEGQSPGRSGARRVLRHEQGQLIKELMRKDIEAARLKKGYAVKGSGTEKEFVSISGKNTK
jgi:hypothetical protein